MHFSIYEKIIYPNFEFSTTPIDVLVGSKLTSHFFIPDSSQKLCQILQYRFFIVMKLFIIILIICVPSRFHSLLFSITSYFDGYAFWRVTS